MLQPARSLDGKTGANGNEKECQQEYDKEFHRDGIGNGSRRMFRMNMKGFHYGQHRLAEETVQECGESQLFHFKISMIRERETADPFAPLEKF